jgi:nitroreductase
MHVSEALRARKSTRAFLPLEVDRAIIERILRAARHAPSGVNAQPWQVAVVSGAKKKQLQSELEAAFRNGAPRQMDYQYYPVEWQEPYRQRRKDCGLQLYASVQIRREDQERRNEQWAANYRAFDAPVMLLFFMDPVMQAGSYMDYGMFLQSIMLAAVEEGLATCPQAALGEFPAIVKQSLGYPPDSVLMCGMALGYEDARTPVNRFRTPREELDRFVQFFS